MGGEQQIVAMGGGGFMMEPDNPLLDDFVLGLTGKPRPRVCFVPTAVGDDREVIARFYAAFPEGRCDATHLPLVEHPGVDVARERVVHQDVVYVGGGNTVLMLAAWRAFGVDALLREALAGGTILCGLSAGSLCWFEGGTTDSYGSLDALADGLGLLPGSNCPHYDGEPGRRPLYQRLVGEGRLAAGYAADDGAGLHFVDGELREVVTSRREARAYSVEPGADGAIETVLSSRFLGV